MEKDLLSMSATQLIHEIQRLQKELGSLKHRIKHEAMEATLCISGSNPADYNIDMCHSRLRNILKSVSKAF